MEEYTVKIDDKGNIQWYQNGKYHRLGGPAVDCVDGYKVWYREGKLHRTDGPAVEDINGYKVWYQDDNLHRLDGPAIENADGSGSKEWYIDGKEYSQDEFNKITKTETKELTVEQISSLLGYKIKIVG